MKKAIGILVFILILASCKKTKEVSKIVGKDWLLGKWENNSDNGNLSETWVKINDSLFNGESYFIKGEDTLHFERIQLKQKGEELFYIATVKGQNNDKAVTFKFKDTIGKQLTFENSKHDFPQKITYTLINKDSLVASISGVQLGKPSSESYPMKKSK